MNTIGTRPLSLLTLVLLALTVACAPETPQAKRDRFRELLAGSNFKFRPVDGAYFQLADYSRLSAESDLDFCEWLVKDGGVAASPVSTFYETPPPDMKLIRFCFAKADATLVRAAERLCAL